jgi:hypothetical protein
VGLWSIYNAADLIQESMRSLLSVVDEFWIYDGKFSGFECPCGREHNFSCDDTGEKVEKFKDETNAIVHYLPMETMWEYDKRQRMFDDLATGDIGLVIDDDELFYGSAQEVKDFAVIGYPRWVMESSLNPRLTSRPGPFAPYKAGYMWMLELGGGLRSYIRVHVKTPNLKLVSPEDKLDYSFVDDEGIYKPEQVYALKNARLIHAMASGQPNIPAYRNKKREAAGFKYHVDMGKGKIAAALGRTKP